MEEGVGIILCVWHSFMIFCCVLLMVLDCRYRKVNRTTSKMAKSAVAATRIRVKVSLVVSLLELFSKEHDEAGSWSSLSLVERGW